MAMRVPDNIPTTQTVFARDGSAPYMSVPAANPEAFGGMAARALSGVGQTLGQSGDQTAQTALMQQQFANESSAMSALNTFQQQASDLMNGNADKGVAGFTSLLGKDAVQQQGTYQAQLQGAFDQARAALNPAAQRMFDMSGRWALRGAVDRLGDHAAQQQVVYNYREARSSVQLNQQAAVDGADDPDTWANALAATQAASQKSSQIMGLDGDAAEAVRKKDLSDVYVQRAQQLAARDPISAQNFYRQNIGMFEPNIRYGVERMLNETTATQYAATDGSTATAIVLGGKPSSGVPQNFNADTVKPYTPEQISDIAQKVKAPSQYDDIFKEVGAKYGIDPTELKMRAVVESGLNPAAVSSQGASGLAQITPGTARALGVDPSNPEQSIEGMARLMVRAEGSSGSADMGAVDRAYYGGSPTAQGPNTSQYAANLAAVRHTLYGPSGGAPLSADDIEAREGDVDAQARQLAEQRRPGDAVYADRVAAEANKNWARQLQEVRGRDYANMTSVLDTVVKSGLQSPGELPAQLQQTYAQLTPRDMLSVQQIMRNNQRAASGEFTPSDPKVFNDAQSRINLPAGDPNRLTDPSEITPLIAHGLSFSDANRLIGEMKDLNSPATNPFMKQVNLVKQTAQRMLTSSVSAVAIQHPEAAAEAAYRFGYALDQQIATMRKAGKDPQVLFDPTSPAYVLSPSRVISYMPTEAELVARKAGGSPTPVGGAAPAASAPAAPGGMAPLRQPGETPQAYLARVGVATGGAR